WLRSGPLGTILGMLTRSPRHACLRELLMRWGCRLGRRKEMIGLLPAIALLAGLWLPSFRESEWTTRAVLRTPGDTWPMAFSPDGRTFATSGGGGITLWDVATGGRRATWGVPDGQAARSEER